MDSTCLRASPPRHDSFAYQIKGGADHVDARVNRAAGKNYPSFMVYIQATASEISFAYLIHDAPVQNRVSLAHTSSPPYDAKRHLPYKYTVHIKKKHVPAILYNIKQTLPRSRTGGQDCLKSMLLQPPGGLAGGVNTGATSAPRAPRAAPSNKAVLASLCRFLTNSADIPVVIDLSRHEPRCVSAHDF